MKYVAIKDIVHSVSQTHKFEKDHLKAVNTSDVLGGELFDVPYSETALLKGQFKKTIRFNDILFSEIRPANRRFARVNIKETADYVVSTKLMVLRKFNDSVDLDYFYYCLTNQSFLETLQRRAENRIGSFPQITFDLLGEYKFPIPTLDKQKRIASVIANIDSKINVNREINRNLEAMARQLYDYWFVQFDFPDENGRPYKSSGGNMVWNERLKRHIPEGWVTKMIKEFAEIQRDTCSPNTYPDTVYHHFSIPAFDKTGAYVLERGSEIQSDKFIITADDILISKLNPWTSRVVWCGEYPDQVASTEFVVLRPNFEDRGYLYMVLKDPKLIVYASKGATGTSNSHKRVNPEFLTAYRIPYELSVVSKFSGYISSIQTQLLKNRNEITQLIKQRDELLPLLMNGQVSVMPPEVNCDLSHD